MFSRPQTRDTKIEGNWFGNSGYNASPDQRNKPLVVSKNIGNGGIRVDLFSTNLIVASNDRKEWVKE